MAGGSVELTAFSELRSSLFVSQKLGALSTSENAKDLISLGELLATGKIFPAIDRTYPLSEVPAAVRYVQEGNAARQGRDHRVSRKRSGAHSAHLAAEVRLGPGSVGVEDAVS